MSKGSDTSQSAAEAQQIVQGVISSYGSVISDAARFATATQTDQCYLVGRMEELVAAISSSHGKLSDGSEWFVCQAWN